jgi:dipeptidyl aminopeptidase/acylaminoacyl peptidase
LADGLVASNDGTRIAFVRNVAGERVVYVAQAPAFTPVKVSNFRGDDGQELTGLRFSPDGRRLVFVRGGDHDGNYPGAPPNAASSPEEPRVMIWQVDLAGDAIAHPLVEGDAPALSADGRIAFVREGVVYGLDRDGKAERLFYDRGKDHGLTWAPDGTRLAFVSGRGDHSFIGVFAAQDRPLIWLAPTVGEDDDAIWSPDGRTIAYTHVSGYAGPPALLAQRAEPWSIKLADAATGVGRTVWSSGSGLRDSWPAVTGGANLHWAGADSLTFLSTADNWPHLYALDWHSGSTRLLTPGAFMVEHVGVSHDGQTLYYSGNTGTTAHDDDRSHVFKVSVKGGAPVSVTAGTGLEWAPVALSHGVAFVAATAQAPVCVAIADATGTRVLPGQSAPDSFPQSALITPRAVTFAAPDGQIIHGQVFEGKGDGPKPGVIFVHGGPSRQMLLGWAYMRYYSNAYAMNQYLAAHGFTVLSVNYRLGIGYGYDFQHAKGGGWRGSSEYQDVLAGARFLQTVPGVDPARIGIWGGSYGGILTALALARNSDVFKAGVDFHGVHDWSLDLGDDVGSSAMNGLPYGRYEQGDREAGMKVAFESSAIANLADWTSPVLFIHGDDDHNVRFDQTVDMERRLAALGKAPIEDLILPDEVHDFLRAQDWLKADRAMADFLTRKLGDR